MARIGSFSPCFLKISISLSFTSTHSSNIQYVAPSYDFFMWLKAINYLSRSLMCEKETKKQSGMLHFIECLKWFGVSAELQGNFITRSSTSLKVATERRSRMRHYPFLPFGGKWLGVSGHIWSVAAQSQISNINTKLFTAFSKSSPNAEWKGSDFQHV